MIWEYKYVTIHSTHPDNIVKELNEFGKDCWEVLEMKEYNIHCNEGGYDRVGVYLKRYVKSEKTKYLEHVAMRKVNKKR